MNIGILLSIAGGNALNKGGVPLGFAYVRTVPGTRMIDQDGRTVVGVDLGRLAA